MSRILIRVGCIAMRKFALLDALSDETRRVSARSRLLFNRSGELSPTEYSEMCGLWEYERRLNLIQALLTIAQSGLASGSLQDEEKRFRMGVVKHGSATDDNIAAAASVFLRRDGKETALRVGRAGPPLGGLLVEASDVIGSAEFFKANLRAIPALATMQPEAWEKAYRALMLAVDALMSCPRHTPKKPKRGPQLRRRRKVA
jgi:hypothetical protein